ncbi:hypothetical protein NKH77_26965 [Streptomyces sp. M19]
MRTITNRVLLALTGLLLLALGLAVLATGWDLGAAGTSTHPVPGCPSTARTTCCSATGSEPATATTTGSGPWSSAPWARSRWASCGGCWPSYVPDERAESAWRPAARTTATARTPMTARTTGTPPPGCAGAPWRAPLPPRPRRRRVGAAYARVDGTRPGRMTVRLRVALAPHAVPETVLARLDSVVLEHARASRPPGLRAEAQLRAVRHRASRVG